MSYLYLIFMGWVVAAGFTGRWWCSGKVPSALHCHDCHDCTGLSPLVGVRGEFPRSSRKAHTQLSRLRGATENVYAGRRNTTYLVSRYVSSIKPIRFEKRIHRAWQRSQMTEVAFTVDHWWRMYPHHSPTSFSTLPLLETRTWRNNMQKTLCW